MTIAKNIHVQHILRMYLIDNSSECSHKSDISSYGRYSFYAQLA